LSVGRHSADRVTENGDYVAMMQRMVRGLERRAIEDPSVLAEVIMLAQRLAEIPNVVIATSAARYSLDPYASPSAGEIGRLLGMTKQSAADRRRIGDRILAERAIGEATIPQRERAARTRARQHAEDTLSSWLQRADHLPAPEVADA
jgi:hypothetical protein